MDPLLYPQTLRIARQMALHSLAAVPEKKVENHWQRSYAVRHGTRPLPLRRRSGIVFSSATQSQKFFRRIAIRLWRTRLAASGVVRPMSLARQPALSSVGELPPHEAFEETLECSTEFKFGIEAHWAKCLVYDFGGMDGNERVTSLAMPKGARHLWPVSRIFAVSHDNHEPPLPSKTRR
jgi:hypothetical protein